MTTTTNPILTARESYGSPADWWLHDIACIREQALPEEGEYPGTMIEILDAIGMWDDASGSAIGYGDERDEPAIWADRMATLAEAEAALRSEVTE